MSTSLRVQECPERRVVQYIALPFSVSCPFAVWPKPRSRSQGFRASAGTFAPPFGTRSGTNFFGSAPTPVRTDSTSDTELQFSTASGNTSNSAPNVTQSHHSRAMPCSRFGVFVQSELPPYNGQLVHRTRPIRLWNLYNKPPYRTDHRSPRPLPIRSFLSHFIVPLEPRALIKRGTLNPRPLCTHPVSASVG